jgi:hypothetical protein
MNSLDWNFMLAIFLSKSVVFLSVSLVVGILFYKVEFRIRRITPDAYLMGCGRGGGL